MNKNNFWKPGQSGNPKGRPALPAELKLKIKGTRHKIYTTVSEYFDKPVSELETLKKDKSITALERAVIGLLYKAFNGNRYCFEYLATLFTGRQPLALDIQKGDAKDLFATMTKLEFIEKGRAVLQRLEMNLKAPEKGGEHDKQLTTATPDTPE